jgi:glycerol-3-phosphate responsive antiterminator
VEYPTWSTLDSDSGSGLPSKNKTAGLISLASNLLRKAERSSIFFFLLLVDSMSLQSDTNDVRDVGTDYK